MSVLNFKELSLSTQLLATLTKEGFQQATPIQQKAIPVILQGKDVLGIAQTGSGKTLSYVLPILMNLAKKTNADNRCIDILIVVPTRELASQVRDVVKLFSINLTYPIKSLAVFGGVSINPQMQALNRVNILVTTPGRLLELEESNALSLKKVQTLVLDEADKLLLPGFKEEMDRIFTLLPSKRQNLLFSATLSPSISSEKLLKLDQALLIDVSPKSDIKKDSKKEKPLIDHRAYSVTEDRKGPFLRYLIKSLNLQQVLVFASTTYKADNIADKLRKNGIQAKAMHGKKSQKTRTDALHDFKAGKLQVLVATDLLGRGIDIEALPCVINYELPRSPKEYIHRVGRTGRADISGKAYAFIDQEELTHFKMILKKMKTYVDLIKTKDIDLHGY